MNIDLNKIQKIYFIGIKGVAVSGLAIICKQMGKQVAGSDVEQKFITDEILHKNNVVVYESFDPDHFHDTPDLVVIGASWDGQNSEVAFVKENNIPHTSESVFRGEISKLKNTIAVTGVHGKTTTTAIIAHALEYLQLSPSYLIGTGAVPGLSGNAAWQHGEHFVVEGDEYARNVFDKTPKFLDLHPTVTIITNIEWEHVDVFQSVSVMEEYFLKLIENTKEFIVACGDWPSVKTVIAKSSKKIITYGKAEDNDWQAKNIRYENEHTVFDVKKGDLVLEDFTISLAGEHNVMNTLAAVIVLTNLGLKLGEIKQAVLNFKGTKRRFEVTHRRGIVLIDDYAHHPTEIKATLTAVAQKFPSKKIWCVFQPHTFSRTKAFLQDFAKSFNSCNRLYITDIFASAREIESNVSSLELAELAKQFHPDVIYAGSITDAAAKIAPELQNDIVLVTIGAGNIYQLQEKLFEKP